MYLKRLEIQGFKSFAHKTVLDFLPPKNGRHSITSIVGPNGAGKSNISDSIRWVMGETSLKAIRGKKSEDVIFHGSDNKRSVGAAEVIMVLDNSVNSGTTKTDKEKTDTDLIVDLPEIIIARRLYRSGESEYLVNNKSVRLLDVHLLLARLKFGQHAYSIIGQGMIDRLLTVNASERKSFFDEAAGIKEYQIKQHQAVLKLARTTENINQAEALLKEVTPRMRLLGRQVKKLEKRKEIEHILREAQEKYYTLLYTDNINKTNEQQLKLGKIDERYRAVFAQLTKHQEELSALAKGASRDEAFNKLQQKHQAAVRQHNELEKKTAILDGQLKTEYSSKGQQQTGWLESKIGELKAQESDLDRKRQYFINEKDNQEKKVTSARTEHERLLTEQSELKVRISRLQSGAILPDITNQNYLHLSGQEAVGALGSVKNSFGGNMAMLAKQKKEQEFEISFFETKNEHSELLKKLVGKAKSFTAKLSLFSPKDAEHQKADLTLTTNKLNQVEVNLVSSQNLLMEVEVAKRTSNEKLQLMESEHTLVAKELASLEQELSLAKASPGELSEKLKQLAQEKEIVIAEAKRKNKIISQVEKQITEFNKNEEEKKQRVFTLQNEMQKKQILVNEVMAERSIVNIELAKLDTKQEDLATEVQHELKEQVSSVVGRLGADIVLTSGDSKAIAAELDDLIQKQKYQLSLIGGIDTETVDEYTEVKEKHDFLTEQLKDLKAATADLEIMVAELDDLMKKKRSVAFKKIRREFSRYFAILFEGGKADLEESYGEVATEDTSEEDESLEDTPIELLKPKKREKVLTGIEVIAEPPGKKVKYLSMLSGGERTLTSIALICAILHNNPSPFVVLDEVEAALDEANTQRFVRIIGELSNQSQFIMVTHNRVTMHASDALYGVVMGKSGSSELLSVKVAEAIEYSEIL